MFNAENLIMDSTVATSSESSQASNDAQLFSTLCEIDKHNYLYLFERCKANNVNVRQLRYLEKEHIRRIIAPDQVGIMAEFEYNHGIWRKQFQTQLPSEAESSKQLQIAKVVGASIPSSAVTTKTPDSATTTSVDDSFTRSPETNHQPVAGFDATASTTVNKTFKRKFNFRGHKASHNVEHEFLLDEIIEQDMRRVRDEYKKNGILTQRERRRLSSALVEYFRDHDIYMSKDIMESLALQIATVFPTESKLAWHDATGKQRKGRLTLKLYNMQRAKKRERTKYGEDEDDGDEEQLQTTGTKSPNEFMDEATQSESVGQVIEDSEEGRSQYWLSIGKFEDDDDLLQMWHETSVFRTKQFKEYKIPESERLQDIFEQWPAYKEPIARTLVSIDFNTLYPHSEATFQERFPIFMQKIHKLYKLEVRLDMYNYYYRNASNLSKETKHYISINLLHAIVRPTRPINPKQMGRRYSTVDSQNAFSRIITNPSEMDDYTVAQPMIFIQGTTFSVEKVFVAFKDIRYEMEFMEALQMCLHIFLTFKLDFPVACMNFWTFVELYFFNITPEPETNLAVIDDIIKFLLAKHL